MADSGEKGAEKRRLRDEVAALAGQVAGLRAELAAARAAQHCHCNWGHCWCYVVHSYAVGPAQPLGLPRVWYGTVTSGGTPDCAITTTNSVTLSAPGVNPAATTLSLS